jgi:hypothetical protein
LRGGFSQLRLAARALPSSLPKETSANQNQKDRRSALYATFSNKRHPRYLVGSGIPLRTLADVENPNCPALLIDFVENPVNSPALTKKQTADVALCVTGFTSHRATIRK